MVVYRLDVPETEQYSFLYRHRARWMKSCLLLASEKAHAYRPDAAIFAFKLAVFQD